MMWRPEGDPFFAVPWSILVPLAAAGGPWGSVLGIGPFGKCPFRLNRPRGLGRPQGRCRQPPLSAFADSRLLASGSSPVSARYATGIWRRRATPSFWRRASEWALAVRGEIPSRSPTSSFEHPAAISSMTSIWRSVNLGREDFSASYIAAKLL